MNKARVEADNLREEAKRLLRYLMDIPEGYSNGMVERFVDCVIFSATLEVAALQSEAIEE